MLRSICGPTYSELLRDSFRETTTLIAAQIAPRLPALSRRTIRTSSTVFLRGLKLIGGRASQSRFASHLRCKIRAGDRDAGIGGRIRKKLVSFARRRRALIALATSIYRRDTEYLRTTSTPNDDAKQFESHWTNERAAWSTPRRPLISSKCESRSNKYNFDTACN